MLLLLGLMLLLFLLPTRYNRGIVRLITTPIIIITKIVPGLDDDITDDSWLFTR